MFVQPLLTKLESKPGKIKKFVAKTSQKIHEKIYDFCDLTATGSYKRPSFVTIAATFLLGARFFQARNNDERREVFTRDFCAVVAAVYTVPLLKKLAGNILSKKHGIPIVHGENKKITETTKLKKYWQIFLQKLNPEAGKVLVPYHQLENWFSIKKGKTADEAIKVFENGMIKGGFLGFIENIHNIKGNINTCFKKLGSETLTTLSKAVGFTEKLDANENIIKMLKKAEDMKTDKNVKTAYDNVKKLFIQDEKGMNPLLRIASNSKSAIEFSAIAITAFILGGFLPWFNIHYTRKIYKDPQSIINKPNTANSTKSAEGKQIHIGNGSSSPSQPNNNNNSVNKNMFEKFNQFQDGLL